MHESSPLCPRGEVDGSLLEKHNFDLYGVQTIYSKNELNNFGRLKSKRDIFRPTSKWSSPTSVAEPSLFDIRIFRAIDIGEDYSG